jgi:hypothetical protein
MSCRIPHIYATAHLKTFTKRRWNLAKLLHGNWTTNIMQAYRMRDKQEEFEEGILL